MKFLVAISLCCSALAVSALAAAPPVRILPLGDSITYGAGTPGGYRWPLYQMLTSAGYSVEYTGTTTNNSPPEMVMHHDGWGGYRIDNIFDWTPVIYAQTEDPDVILIMLGTNDYGQNYDTPNALNRIDALIIDLANHWPYAKIVVASMVPTLMSCQTSMDLTYNQLLPGNVANLVAQGRQVYFADQRNALTAADTYDGVHPTTTGYAKMANCWFPVVTSIITPLGTANAPAVVSVAPGTSTSTNLTLSFNKPVSNNATNLSNFALSSGTILSATLDPTYRRDVTLNTSSMSDGSYTLTVQNVTDMTPANTSMASTNLTVVVPKVIKKANNTNNLNLGTSWTGGTAPASSTLDIAQWDSTVTGANTTKPAANLSWRGIIITNPGGAVTINANSSTNITLGAAGIDMSASTRNLTINCPLVLSAAQTWNVAYLHTLTTDAITGTGGVTKGGLGTWQLAAANGASTYSGDTVIGANCTAVLV